MISLPADTTVGLTVGTSMTDLASALLRTRAARNSAHRWFGQWDDDDRTTWYYTPTDHGGLPLGAQRPAQQQLSMRLVAAGLSREAYNTVAAVMGIENILDRVEDWQRDWRRERGRDPGLYWLRIFGEPVGIGGDGASAATTSR